MKGRVCQACGAANDETRIFCSNCGARLEGDIVNLGGAGATAESKPLAAPPLPQQTGRKRGPGRPPGSASRTGVSFVRQLVFTAVVAAFVAAIIQMARTPDNIPPKESVSQANARETLEQLQSAAASRLPTTWVINQTAINEFLVTTIQMNSTVDSSLSAQFVRSFVVTESGAFELGIEQRFLGRPLFFLIRGVPEPSGSRLKVRWVGGFIGRLPVHPNLLPALQVLFRPTFAGLAQALEPLALAGRATISPADVTLEWPGTQTPAP
ncbi:MAG: zinc ribbon domain-containing protein [Terrimicrobiaceae bacterium]|nr:zinc ribbon domain-containing protein [Terrimicrobiaceae bacterium]